MGRTIEKQLQDAGFRMLGSHKKIDGLIIAILDTENNRYLKAIPFLINKYKPNIHIIYERSENKELCTAVLGITSQLFSELNTNTVMPGYHLDQKLLKKLKLNYNEFKEEFELQLKNEEKPNLLLDKQKIYAERNLQMWILQLFTKKEKYIMKRILNNKPVSRTDYEYYSRKTRKKLNSIIGLQDFAQTLQAKTPEYDFDLFRLKKLLEQFFKSKTGSEEAIEEFRFSKDKVIISSRKEDGETSLTAFPLKQIKDQEILDLLNKYSEHNFM